jgi:hypothetical protein
MLPMGSSYPIDTMLVQKPSDGIGTVSYRPATDLYVMHNAIHAKEYCPDVYKTVFSKLDVYKRVVLWTGKLMAYSFVKRVF